MQYIKFTLWNSFQIPQGKQNNKHMKKIFLATALSLISIMAWAQTSKISGRWLLTKVETQNGVDEPFFITDFNADGSMVMMDMDAGTWKYDKSKKAIFIFSQRNKKMNGESKVEKLTKNKMILNKNNARLFYIKINQKDIARNNAKFNLTGVWKAQPDENSTIFLKFIAPDSLVKVTTGDGSVETAHDSWIFNPKDKTLIIIGFSAEMRGKHKVKELTANRLVLEKEGNTLTAERIDDNSDNIEKLTFTYDDFPEENNSEDLLPWRNFEEMTDFLSGVKKLTYRHGTLLAEINVFEYKTYYSDIKVNRDKPSVDFSNFVVENGNPEQYSEKYKGGLSEKYNNFFPLNDIMPYRIKGKDTVTVPAGTFKCTVVEGLDGDNKVKLWMIDDKPGIYAKKVYLGDNFGAMVYSVDELKKIE